MANDLTEKYVDEQCAYLFNKYFYKLILEKKYIENFGEIEIARMESIYDSMIINKKLEDLFFSGGNESIQEDIYIDYNARKEFFDLERQIKEMKTNMSSNSKDLKDLEQYYNKDLKSKFESIIRKASPYLNSSKKAGDIWKKFNLALEKENWKEIIKLEQVARGLRVYKRDISEAELNRVIKDIQKARLSVRNRHPFNMIETLNDEESLKNKQDEEISNVKSIRESYAKIADIYLATSTEPRWFS